MTQYTFLDDEGNDPDPWITAANDLIASRDSLAQNRALAEEAAKSTPMPRMVPSHARSYWVELMLVGFALENLLKALLLVRGKVLYRGGKLLKLEGVKSHDLAALADHAGFELHAEERNLLGNLSLIMVGVGRYPFSPNPGRQVTTEGWSDYADRRVIEIVRRISDVIRK